jgi:hypothetical protein
MELELLDTLFRRSDLGLGLHETVGFEEGAHQASLN